MAMLHTSSDLYPGQAPSRSTTTSPMLLSTTLADCMIMSPIPTIDSIPEGEEDRNINELERRVKEFQETIQKRDDANLHLQHNINCIKNDMKQVTKLGGTTAEKDKIIDSQSKLFKKKDEAKPTTSRGPIDQEFVAQLQVALTAKDRTIAYQADLLRRNEEVKEYLQGQVTRYRGNIEQLSVDLHEANSIIGERNATNDFVMGQVIELEEKNKRLEEDNECLTRRVLYLESQCCMGRTEGMITVPARGLKRGCEVKIDEARAKLWKGDCILEDACS